VFEQYWRVFAELATKPFASGTLIWGIVPLYFGWFLNELSPSKANFRTAIQTGFTLVWASAQWLYHAGFWRITLAELRVVNVAVTVLVMAVGILALLSGVTRRFPRYASFLGHTRFSGYFMIMMFPIQAGPLNWTWERLWVILLFAVPIWVVVHLAFMPFRRQ
jgi:hypothetical protein